MHVDAVEEMGDGVVGGDEGFCGGWYGICYVQGHLTADLLSDTGHLDELLRQNQVFGY